MILGGQKVKLKVAQSGLILCAPWTIQSMEFSRPEYWSGWPFPSPGDLSNSGIEPSSPALQAILYKQIIYLILTCIIAA